MATPIAQEHPAGCAVACVAFALGINYKEALLLFVKGASRAGVRGFYVREVVAALGRGAKGYSYYYINTHNRANMYKDGCIVFTRRSKRYPQGHYLCRNGRYWMNPWHNFPEMNNVSARFQKRLPGRPAYAIVPIA